MDKIGKEDFESMIIFLSNYNKAKGMNARLHNLFTVVDEACLNSRQFGTKMVATSTSTIANSKGLERKIRTLLSYELGERKFTLNKV